MSDGMPGVWVTLAGAVPGVDTEPGPDAATVTYPENDAHEARPWFTPGTEPAGDLMSLARAAAAAWHEPTEEPTP